MEKKTIQTILDEIRKNPKAAEFLKEKEAAGTPEEAGALWASAAAELGHSITAEEIGEYIKTSEDELKQKAQAAGDEIQSLSEDELKEVAGGKDHSSCKDTYKDRENCWIHDGCDVINNHYSDYKCHYNTKDVKCGKYEKCFEESVYG